MKEIRDAVNVVRQNCYLSSPEIHNALLTLLDLAEKVLAVGLGLSAEEFEKALNQSWYENYGDPKHPYSIELADAIHKAQMEKLGGVR